LVRLDLSWNSVTNVGAASVAAVLSGNATLESLNLSSNAIGTEGIAAIVQALYSDLALIELDIVGNQLRDATALVAYIVHDSYKLQRLAYEKNKLSVEQEAQVMQAFQFRDNKRTWLGQLAKRMARQRMMSVRLEHVDFGDDEVMFIAHTLAKHNALKVTTVFLSSPRVTDRGAVALTKHVLSNPNAAQILRLYGTGFRLSAQGVAAMAQSLTRPDCPLFCLELSKCQINGLGAKRLADALEHNTSLTRVDFHSNLITDAGAKAMFAAVLDPPHPKLVSINLARNNLTDDALVMLGSLVRLQDLQLEGNYISDRGALYIANAGMGSLSLQRINLNHNCLTTKGIQTLNLYLRHASILECRDQRPIDDTPP
jgi:NLR family CARD domain-containing protein 3